MSRPNPAILSTVLLLFLIAFGSLPLLKGGLYLGTHEGDTYHLLDILFRMKQGMIPHIDFPTPLGIMSFLPFAVFLDAGMSVGQSVILGQLVVGLALWPLVAYAASTRMSRPVAYYFGLMTLALVVALSFSGATSRVAISMYYNRWCWSVTFLILALAFLSSHGKERARLDSAIVGVLCAGLLLLKITFFVSVFPAAAIALAVRWKGTGLLFAILGGATVFALFTALMGPSLWIGYVADLRTVSTTDVRPFVGVPFNVVLSGPEFLGGTLVAVAMVLLVRRSGHGGLAAALLVMIMGFTYVTYQNFGNDPKWLWFAPVLLLSLRPEIGFGRVAGMDVKSAMTGLAVAAFVLNFSSLTNTFMSNIEHGASDETEYAAMLPQQEGHQDIFIPSHRAYSIVVQHVLEGTEDVWSNYRDLLDRDPPLELGGLTFPSCEFMTGSLAYLERFSIALVDAGVPEGSQIFATDILTAFWLFGPFEPLEAGAPWYYGNLSGLENADYVLAPKCSFVPRISKIMIDELNATDVQLELVVDNELFALFVPRF